MAFQYACRLLVNLNLIPNVSATLKQSRNKTELIYIKQVQAALYSSLKGHTI